MAKSSHEKIIARSTEIKDELEPLFLAAKTGNCETITALLATGRCSVHDHDKIKGQTPLHLAAEFNQVEAIRLLVTEGASINFDAKTLQDDDKTFDESGAFRQLPIHCAAKAGACDAIKVLTELGAILEAKEADGYTPLHLAAKHGHLECVIALCDRNVNINPTNELPGSTDKGRTPLHLAILAQRIPVALELLRRGADFLAKDSHDQTPFFWASKMGLTEIVTEITRLIREKQPAGQQLKAINHNNSDQPSVLNTLNAIDKDGNTELHRAARSGAINTIFELHQLGADLNARNRAGETPLYVACDIEAIKATINRKYEQDSYALDTRQAPVVAKLLELGADRNIPGDRNNTPLHLATLNNSNQLIKLLCENNNQVNAINDSEQTSMHIAATEKNSKAINYILQAGGNVNAIDDDKNTPLHVVLLKDDDDEFDDDDLKFIERCVVSLLEKGSRVKTPNENNETPLSLAEENFGKDSPIYAKIKAAADAEQEIEQQLPQPSHETPLAEVAAASSSELVLGIHRAPSPDLSDADRKRLEELTLALISLDESVNGEDKPPGDANLLEESYFHTLAKNPNCAEAFDRFIQGVDIDELQSLMREKTANQENALHSACRYHNYALLKKFTDVFSTDFLAHLALCTNSDGLNALQLLIWCGLDQRTIEFKTLMDRNDIELRKCRRNYLEKSQTPATLLPMLELFQTKINAPNLVLATDALMLACYTNNLAMLKCVVAILKTPEQIAQTACQKLAQTKITALQFLCAFGHSTSIQYIFEKLAHLASATCVKQSALDYCYKTRVTDDEDFCTIITLMHKFYGDQNNCFVKAMLKPSQPSPLVYSLHHEKILPSILMNKKRVPCRYAVLCDALEGRCDEQSPQYGFFAQSKESDSIRLNLLRHLFRIDWPVTLIDHIAQVLQAYRKHELIQHGDPKYFILNILFEYFILKTDEDKANSVSTELEHSCIALALFYQINEKDLYHRENDLLLNYGRADYAPIIMGALSRFLQAMGREDSSMQQKLLSRTFKSRSIFLALLLRCLPQLGVHEKGVEAKFISTIQSMTESFTQNQTGEHHGNGIK